MKLPQRVEAHITETESWKVLSARAPENWIVRELSERDYGIDCYVELCSKENELTGDFFLAQLKGLKTPIEWRDIEPTGKLRHFQFSGIKASTVNYWMNLRVPVFLFVADCTSNQLFFVDAKQQVRYHYNEFLSQQSFGFRVNELYELGTKFGNIFFLAAYFMEREFPEFMFRVVTLLSHWQEYLAFIEANSNLDSFIEVEEQDEIYFITIYRLCEFLARFVRVKWEVIPLNDLYAQERTRFQDYPGSLHNLSLEVVLPALRAALLEIVRKLLILVGEDQKDFWEKEHEAIFRACLNLTLNS